MLTIREHLCSELASGRVGSSYVPLQPREITERADAFTKRVANHCAKPQFVKVAHGGQDFFIAFGPAGPLITSKGKFLCIPGEIVGGQWGVHYALVFPDLETVLKQKNILVRIDSGCYSGMVFGDSTCDCKAQLEKSMNLCVERGSGIIIHVPQHDGRGWGDYKLANQLLMDELKINTVEAARLFYVDEDSIDQRTYFESALMLKALGIRCQCIELATNNPKKLEAFRYFQIDIRSTSSIVSENMSSTARKNLKAKSKQWNHNIGNGFISEHVHSTTE